MKIAGVMQVRNYSDDCRAFLQLQAISDYTIVLDDRSTRPFPYRPTVLLSKSESTPSNWNCTANLTTLFYQAFVMGCEWIVRLDADMLLSRHLHHKEQIAKLCDAKYDVISFRLFDLWNDPTKMRVDGIWGTKSFPLICRNWMFDKCITLQDARERRLHQHITPSGHVPNTKPATDGVIYHTGCISEVNRRARVSKYATEDPGNKLQNDYNYVTDERGLVLEDVPMSDRCKFPIQFQPLWP